MKLGPLVICFLLFLAGIPAGSFAMRDDPELAQGNERPVHRVAISGSWIASMAITLKRWKGFLADSGYLAGRSRAESDDHPVVGISLP